MTAQFFAAVLSSGGVVARKCKRTPILSSNKRIVVIAALLMSLSTEPGSAAGVARSSGGLDIQPQVNMALAEDATGSNTVYAKAGNLVAGKDDVSSVFTLNKRQIKLPGFPSTINVANGPLKGMYAGLGTGQVSKFDAADNRRTSVVGTALSVDDPVTGKVLTLVGSNAKWSANPVQKSSKLNSVTQVEQAVGGPAGIAVAKATDPYFFTPTATTVLHLAITLVGVNLTVTTDDPNEFGRNPGFRIIPTRRPVEYEFGAADTRSMGFLSRGHERWFLPLSSATLFDETFTLVPGNTYRLDADIQTAAMIAVPKPCALLLLSMGLVGLFAYRRESPEQETIAIPHDPGPAWRHHPSGGWGFVRPDPRHGDFVMTDRLIDAGLMVLGAVLTIERRKAPSPRASWLPTRTPACGSPSHPVQRAARFHQQLHRSWADIDSRQPVRRRGRSRYRGCPPCPSLPPRSSLAPAWSDSSATVGGGGSRMPETDVNVKVL